MRDLHESAHPAVGTLTCHLPGFTHPIAPGGWYTMYGFVHLTRPLALVLVPASETR